MPNIRSRGRYRLLISVLLAMTVALVASACASSGSAAEGEGATEGPFAGETITLVVANSPSGTMDAYARMIAPYIKEALGAEEIIVDNQNGAGGLEGLNTVWASEPNGLTLGFTAVPTIVLSDLSGSKGARYKAGQFTYLARAAAAPRVLSVGASTTNIHDVSDLKNLNRKFIFAVEGPESDMFYMAAISQTLGFPLKIVTGFKGSGDITQAVLSGAADGMIASVTSAKPQIQAGGFRPIVMLAKDVGKVPWLKNVPGMVEVVDTQRAREIMQAFTNMVALQRTFFAPPDLPKDITKTLRNALHQAITNPELQKKAQKRGLPLDYLAGAKVQKKVEAIMQNSQDIKPILKHAVQLIR